MRAEGGAGSLPAPPKPRALADMISARKVVRLITPVIRSQLIWLITNSLMTPPYWEGSWEDVRWERVVRLGTVACGKIEEELSSTSIARHAEAEERECSTAESQGMIKRRHIPCIWPPLLAAFSISIAEIPPQTQRVGGTRLNRSGARSVLGERGADAWSRRVGAVRAAGRMS